jgi:hypothetical protein
MVDTAFNIREAKLGRLVVPPTKQRPPTRDVTKPAKLFSAGGGLVSTATDYLRFCQMLLNAGELDGARILRPETAYARTTNALPAGIRFVRNEVGPAGTELQLKINRSGQQDPVVLSVTREAVRSQQAELEVRPVNGKLAVAPVGQWPILEFDDDHEVPAMAVSRDEFRVESEDHTRISFVRDGDGKVSRMVLDAGPWEQSGVRLPER